MLEGNRSQAIVAVSHERWTWHDINWKQAHRNVYRLQTRIVKAVKDKKPRQVRALQRILTRSTSAAAIAVKQVTENTGKRTPGIDGVIWRTVQEKTLGMYKIIKGQYKAKPLRRIYIPKKNGQKRPLGIPTMFDRAKQTLYLLALNPISETTADANSYGFRKNRSTADAIGQIFTVLSRQNSAQWILEADIHSCFDQISHQWILKNIPMDKKVLQQWLSAGYIHKKKWHSTTSGTPQGGAISPVITNMVLDGLERTIKERFAKPGAKVNVIRYADDFVITSKTKEILQNDIQEEVKCFLEKRGLRLSSQKTCITSIDTGFDFLSQNVRKYKGTLLIKPSKSSCKAFMTKIDEVIKGNLHIPAIRLIGLLNPIIRGWANYHRHIVCRKTFEKMDSYIWNKLIRWGKRRHPNKTKKWIFQKYYKPFKGRAMVFSGTNAKGDTIPIFQMTRIHCIRHIKVRNAANIYDPAWSSYFTSRMKRTWLKDGKYRLQSLWKKQQGICPCCHTSITAETGWHIHHVIPRKEVVKTH